jgi:hypothetical protein
MITGRNSQIEAKTVHDHETGAAAGAMMGRLLVAWGDR